MERGNKIANALLIIGVLQIISGFIVGFILANTEIQGLYSSYNEFSWSIFLATVISGIVSGVLFIGLGDIINLLNKIYNRISEPEFNSSVLKGNQQIEE